VQLKEADKISLVYHTNQTKKDEKSKTKKNDEQLSPEMVIKIRESIECIYSTLYSKMRERVILSVLGMNF